MEKKTVPCKWCGEETPMTGTRECDKHWELRTRIEAEPGMAAKILESVRKKETSVRTPPAPMF